MSWAFAPNSPCRPFITKVAVKASPERVPTALQETAQKASKVLFTWSKLIALIYEVDPLLCPCGKEMKIIKIVTDPTHIWPILIKIGWPINISEFDEPKDLVECNICHLTPGRADKFPESYDPPKTSGSDPPDFDDNIDSPHWKILLSNLTNEPLNNSTMLFPAFIFQNSQSNHPF